MIVGTPDDVVYPAIARTIADIEANDLEVAN